MNKYAKVTDVRNASFLVNLQQIAQVYPSGGTVSVEGEEQPVPVLVLELTSGTEIPVAFVAHDQDDPCLAFLRSLHKLAVQF